MRPPVAIPLAEIMIFGTVFSSRLFDSSADLTFIMEGLSHLEWPVVLDNSWGQTERGGTITIESKAKVDGGAAMDIK